MKNTVFKMGSNSYGLLLILCTNMCKVMCDFEKSALEEIGWGWEGVGGGDGDGHSQVFEITSRQLFFPEVS
jgi:hypothetical protein